MFYTYKKLLYLSLITVICSFLMICPAQAADKPPAVGDSPTCIDRSAKKKRSG
jgi:hypothetical protein